MSLKGLFKKELTTYQLQDLPIPKGDGINYAEVEKDLHTETARRAKVAAEEELDRQRVADLKTKAAKARNEESNTGDVGETSYGPSVGTLFASLVKDVMAAVERIKQDERDNTDVAVGEVVYDPPNVPKLGGRAITDTSGAVDANSWPADETPLAKLQRLHPASAPKNRLGEEKKRF